MPFDLAAYDDLDGFLQNFLDYNNSNEFNNELRKIKGFPLLEGTETARGRTKMKTIREVVEWGRKKVSSGTFSVPGGYFQKNVLSYDELLSGRIGAVPKEMSREEKEITSVLERLQKGFIERDTSIVEEWPTQRRLYEVIHDAAWALVEYERTAEFIFPMQLTFGLVKRDAKWKIKQWHWQNPSKGIPLLKLIKHENR